MGEQAQTGSASRGSRRLTARWVRQLVVVGVASLAVGCTGASGAAPGGEEDLPGEVPDGVSFAEAPEGALDAPALEGELTDQTSVSGSDLWADRPVVLVFTASWCGSCAEVHEEVAGVVDDYGDAVALLAVALDEEDPDDLEDYAREVGAEHPVMTAGLADWENYAAEEPPLVALVGPGGKVLRGWPGGVDAEVLDGRLDELVQDSSGDGDGEAAGE